MNTREKEAIAALLRRANARTAAHHSHNTQGAARCLRCGTGARLGETATPAHVFCSVDCQRQLQGLWHFFPLSGNDDPVVVEQGGHKRLLEVEPEGGWPLWMPDEILCALLLAVYDARIDTLDEYDDLMAQRRVSLQFARVIEQCVVPGIAFMAHYLVSQLPLERLLAFRGLTQLDLHLEYFKVAKFTALVTGLPVLAAVRLRAWRKGDEANALILRTLQQKATLTDLSLSGFKCLPNDAWLPMTQLRALRLDMQARDQTFALSTLTSLTLLDIGYVPRAVPMLDPEVFVGLTQLRELRLPSDQPTRTLERLTALRVLSVGEPDAASALTGDTLVSLALLEDLKLDESSSLSEEGLARATQLRSLDLSRCPWYSERALTPLTRLEHLVLAHGAAITKPRAQQLLPRCEIVLHTAYY